MAARNLSTAGDLVEAAANLFAYLAKLDEPDTSWKPGMNGEVSVNIEQKLVMTTGPKVTLRDLPMPCHVAARATPMPDSGVSRK